MKMKKTALSVAMYMAYGLSASGTVSAQGINVFDYIGTGALATAPGGAKGSCDMPTGSWYSIIGGDLTCGGTGGSTYADYRSFRSAGSTAIPGPNGQLNMNIINTITQSNDIVGHNTGNMIDRDSYVEAGWNYEPTIFSDEGWAAHFTTSPLTVVEADAMIAKVNMSGWRLAWHGEAINLGSGFAYAFSNDGIWGNGNDILDYFVPNASSGLASYAGLAVTCCGDNSVGNYYLHLEGSFIPSVVPVPAAIWLMGSGMFGLLGFARRTRGRQSGRL
jgi:hypothetical protein